MSLPTSNVSNLIHDLKIQTEGLPESAELKLKLQLSSPIEEAILTTQDASTTFRAVELGQAMLSMTATDAGDVPLGSSEAMDLASLIQMDAMNASQEYSVTKDIAFRADGSDSADPAVFQATMKLDFVASPKDQREELFELLNKAAARKTQAVEKLRQSALAASRQAGAGGAKKSSEPAVKPGFLNKGGAATGKKEEKGIVSLWKWYFGPQSALRRYLPIAKNYVIFFAAAAIFHYKGDALALPPPV